MLNVFQGTIAPPNADWENLVIALNAIQDESEGGNWYFPCESSITIMFHGSQSREYVIALADPTQPYDKVDGYCLTVANDEGQGQTVWYVCVPVPPWSKLIPL